MKCYLNEVTKQSQAHKLVERQQTIAEKLGKGAISTKQIATMERIDIQKTEIQLGAEKHCQKLMAAPLPFSLPICYLHKQREAFVNLKAWLEKKTSNSHITCDAHKAGIPQPRLRLIADFIAGIVACKRKLKEMQPQAEQLRREHLGNQYELANSLKEEGLQKEIQQIIKREETKSTWSRIKRATGEPRTGATPKVQKMVDGVVVDVVEALSMNLEIQWKTKM
jgi:hypothetical protein